MNVRPDTFVTIWCAARVVGSRRPARSVTAANAPYSSVVCVAAGQPRARSRRKRDGRTPASGRSTPPWRAATTASTPAMYVREMHVAQAAPSTPSAGAPRLPNTRTQFAAAFTALAVTSVTITGVTRVTACR